MSAPVGSGSGAGTSLATTLVCFAVPFEAKPFLKFARRRSDVRVLITGMGARNAARSAGEVLRAPCPARVFTCGFAGALKPQLKCGDVIFETADALLAKKLHAAGARAASLHCAERIAITTHEKSALRRDTNADAVEMESGVIQRLCSEAGVPCATVRAISDEAGEDLPLDFNLLMSTNCELSFPKLLLATLKASHRIPALIRLGRNSAHAANELTRVMEAVFADAT
jgi:adenosylhomocysteine nucleosidase